MESRGPSPLDELGLRHIYDLYTTLAPLVSPVVANEMELWEIAAILGVDASVPEHINLDERLATEATPEQMAHRIATSKIKPRRSNKDTIEPTVDVPEPKPGVEVVDMTEQVMRQMGIRTN